MYPKSTAKALKRQPFHLRQRNRDKRISATLQCRCRDCGHGHVSLPGTSRVAAPKPTEKQLAILKKNGVPTKGLSRRQAGAKIDEIFRRRQQGLCTLRQAALLRKFGEPDNLTFDEASRRISAIADNGWKPLSKNGVRQPSAIGAAEEAGRV